MDTPLGPPASASGTPSAGKKSSKGHVRGSSLLLAGRMVALVLNFLTQVLTVRYLSKAEFGAFAWALSIVAVGTSVNLLGLSKGVARFVPMHEERGEYGAVFGALGVALGGILGLGVALVAIVLGLGATMESGFVADPVASQLLLLLVVLTPLHALDHLLQNVAAVFLGARGIFFRRHILGPLLKLAAILAIIGTHGSLRALAALQVGIGAIGVGAYVSMLGRHFRAKGIWRRAREQGLQWRGRELLRYSLPLVTSDVVLVLQASIAVIVLERTHGTTSVAAMRAVAPVAALCLTAIESFKFLYVPATARLFARGEHAAIGEVYWNTALWISVFSFPVFAASCFLAGPMTTLLFGERYASSGTLLAILACGNYVNACTGLNAYTLQVYGHVRAILGFNLLGAAINVLLCLLLVPRYGALGAAWSTAASVVALNVLNQIGLIRFTSVAGAPRAVMLAYAKIGVGIAVLAALTRVAGVNRLALGAAVAMVSLGLVVWNRSALELGDTFPELRRFARRRSTSKGGSQS